MRPANPSSNFQGKASCEGQVSSLVPVPGALCLRPNELLPMALEEEENCLQRGWLTLSAVSHLTTGRAHAQLASNPCGSPCALD